MAYQEFENPPPVAGRIASAVQQCVLQVCLCPLLQWDRAAFTWSGSAVMGLLH